MNYPIDLRQATESLVAQFGSRFAASRSGGQRQLVASLQRQFGVTDEDAQRVVTILERHGVICWSNAHRVPCPGLLELTGHWRFHLLALQAIEVA
jgi:hypothetical protein